MRRRLLCLCALTILATHLAVARADQPRPYRGAFDFAITGFEVLSGAEVLITGLMAGQETFLGRFEGEVRYLVDFESGTFSGSLYKQAANSDLLFETLTGSFTPTGSEGTFTMTGGTGRFLRASGGGNYVNVWTNPELTTGRVTFSGTIDFRASNRRR